MRLLSIGETATLLGVAVDTLRRWPVRVDSRHMHALWAAIGDT
ncbi:hypothetical protein bAD24_III10560 [Burkholderia sp. AD24]|nr:hypothetical protein bAD24_III10560 [Burkholderia sp. AD24]